MPILSPQTRSITLPITNGTLQIGLSYGDSIALNEILLASQQAVSIDGTESEQDVEKKLKVTPEMVKRHTEEILLRGIKDWDFTDESGVKCPITIENIKILPKEDVDYAVNEINGLKPKARTEEEDNELKKKSLEQ